MDLAKHYPVGSIVYVRRSNNTIERRQIKRIEGTVVYFEDKAKYSFLNSIYLTYDEAKRHSILELESKIRDLRFTLTSLESELQTFKEN
jgi:hypothetical protein